MVKRNKDDITVLELYLMWIGGCITFLIVLEVVNLLFGGK